uniref:F-box domain-containing protein n=1 Tax=Glossina brevipalpis TaxID=37001 RepID=A0A1A9WVG3_9MUSC
MVNLKRKNLDTKNENEHNKRGRYEDIIPLPMDVEYVGQPLPSTLYDMPSDVIERILDYLNLRQHFHLRRISKHVLEISDQYIMHNFLKAFNKCTSTSSNSYKSAVIKTIFQATEVYIRSGFYSTFCGCILPILDNCTKDHYSIHSSQIKNFLLHFYGMTDNLIGDKNSQQSILLYTVTIMRFFKAFRNSAIVHSQTLPSFWKLIVELKGPWLNTSKYSGLAQPQHFISLLVVLMEMLIADIARREQKCIWKRRHKIYISDNNNGGIALGRQSLFTLIIHGSEQIFALLRSCLEVDLEDFKWPLEWPTDQLTVYVNI